MPWLEKIVDCGNVKFVKRYFSSRYGQNRQYYRSSAENTTTEAQEKINDKIKVERFSILANANFVEDDYFLTFTYRRENRPASVEEAKDQWTKFLRKLRAQYKKEGAELKYLWCLEYKNAVYHFHMLCNNAVNSKVFRKLWDFGSVHIENLDGRDYHSVGEYMMKEQYLDKPEKTKSRRCYGSSKNLYRPEPEIKVLDGDNWNEQPEPDAGYQIDNESVENGFITIEDIGVDFRYQFYREIKLTSEQILEQLKEHNPFTRFTVKTPRETLLRELVLLKGGEYCE
ncbi:MAG: hypothetical protein IKO53_04900 [Lachnospiraceae bacterium]|nr:hypothetical protein [Lachnospiraceae bacterium]